MKRSVLVLIIVISILCTSLAFVLSKGYSIESFVEKVVHQKKRKQTRTWSFAWVTKWLTETTYKNITFLHDYELEEIKTTYTESVGEFPNYTRYEVRTDHYHTW